MDPAVFSYVFKKRRETQNFNKFNTEPEIAGTPPTQNSLKKKKGYGRHRDSLQRRLNLGKPGSRRYRQWENEFFLAKNLSETESENSSDDESLAPSYGAFAIVFSSDFKKSFEPFIEITEYQQSLLLKPNVAPKKDPKPPLTIEDVFGSLSPKTRKTLRRHKSSALLHDLDSLIFSFYNGTPLPPLSPSDSSPSSPSFVFEGNSYYSKDFPHPSLPLDDTYESCLIFSFEEKFQRLVLHALCDFYGLVSYSMDVDDERLTVVRQKGEETCQRLHFGDFVADKSPLIDFLLNC